MLDCRIGMYEHNRQQTCVWNHNKNNVCLPLFVFNENMKFSERIIKIVFMDHLLDTFYLSSSARKPKKDYESKETKKFSNGFEIFFYKLAFLFGEWFMREYLA
jgi:hypothetical protein